MKFNKSIVASFYVFCAILFLASVQRADAAISGLVKVQSSYQDPESPTEKWNYKGYGIVVKAENRYFVITDSHLSQGGVKQGNPTVTIEAESENGEQIQTLEVIARVNDNLRDVEVLEVQTFMFSPFAVLDTTANSAFFAKGRLLLHPSVRDLVLTNDSNKLLQINSSTWIPSTKLFDTLEDQQMLRLDGTETELSLGTKIKAGMSGLPLIVNKEGLGAFVVGLVASTSRHFTKSWLVRDEHAIDLLWKLLKNETQELSDSAVSWNSRGGFLYRTGSMVDARKNHLFNFQEVIFDREKLGNGIRADGGGSSNTLAAANDFGGSVELKDGIWYSDKQSKDFKKVTAFKVFYAKDRFQYLLPADMSTIAWMNEALNSEHSISQFDVLAIDESYALSKLMWERWSSIVNRGSFASLHPSRFKIRKGFKNEFRCELLKHPRQVQVCTIEVGFDALKNELMVRFVLPEDELRFSLGAKGELLNKAKEFSSEIEVTGLNTKKVFRVELSGFLMTTPAAFRFSDRATVTSDKGYNNEQVRFHVKSGSKEYLVF